MNILFYTPLNTRCLDIESQAIEFSKLGHNIFLLSQSSEGLLHKSFSKHGFCTASNQSKVRFNYANLLIKFCSLVNFIYRNKIDVVYSHLEPANFISVFAQILVPANVIICRHHINEANLYRFDTDLSYKLTYSLAKNIIVVSKRAKSYMVSKEGVKESKVHHFNLAYNFDLYDQPNSREALAIRDRYPCRILLLSVCRLTKFKRPDLSIQLLSVLKEKGFDVKLVILGNGEMMNSLSADIKNQKLEACVYLAGHVSNVMDFMKAADFLIHPSLLDSSSISSKEAGLAELPIIACRGVGDFDEVIAHNVNGFLVSQDNFVEDATKIIMDTLSEENLKGRIGKKLKATVLREFDIKRVAPLYEQMFHH